MTPRTIAALLLLSLSSLAAAQMISPDYLAPTVGVMLSFQHRPSASYVKRIQGDVEDIFRPSQLDLRWEILDDGAQPGSYSRAVVIEFRGRCGFGRVAEVVPHAEPYPKLGWTVLNDGEVLPHATIDCDQIAAVTAAARSVVPARQTLPTLYHRLTVRVLAHELMHTLLRSADHNNSDCLKTPLRPEDLRAPARLSDHNLQALREVGRASAPVLARTK